MERDLNTMGRRINRGILFIPIAIAGFALFTWIVMLLWNNVLTAATGVHTITYFQALGIFVLSKILFGFNGGWGGKRRRRWRGMDEKFSSMTPEEKEQFKSVWEERCSRWKRTDDTSMPPTT